MTDPKDRPEPEPDDDDLPDAEDDTPEFEIEPEREEPPVAIEAEGEEPEAEDQDSRYRLEHSRRRKAERERDAANRRLVEMDERLATLEGRANQQNVGQVEASLTATEAEYEATKKALRDAKENLDYDAEIEAQEKLLDLRGKRQALARAVQQAKAGGGERREEAPRLTREASEWLERNRGWFDPNLGDEASAAAYRISERLTREGYKHDDPRHFEALDREMQKRFPENYEGTEREPDRETRTKPRPTVVGGSRGGGQERGNGRQKVELPRQLVRNFQAAGLNINDPKVKRQMVKAHLETQETLRARGLIR